MRAEAALILLGPQLLACSEAKPLYQPTPQERAVVDAQIRKCHPPFVQWQQFPKGDWIVQVGGWPGARDQAGKPVMNPIQKCLEPIARNPAVQRKNIFIQLG